MYQICNVRCFLGSKFCIEKSKTLSSIHSALNDDKIINKNKEILSDDEKNMDMVDEQKRETNG